MANQLPEGFTLDNSVSNSLPQGFVVDTQEESFSIPGALDVAGTVATSAIAEPIAGIAGLLEASGRGVANFLGFDGGDAAAEATKTINTVRDFLTADIDTPEGQRQAQQLGQFLEPVTSTFQEVESALGNTVLEKTGSPALAAAAHSLPTAVLELIGVKGLRSARTPLKGEKLSSNVAKAIQQSAPDIDQIRQAKNVAYKELDDFGIKVQSKVYDKFADNIASRLNKEGLDPTLTPKANAAVKRMIAEKGSPKSLQELDTIRKIARGAANDIDKTEARLGSIIINELDKGVETLSNEIGGKFKQARGMAQRGFKSETINDMIENASHTASGLENGLRIEARKILKNKKKRRGFTSDEISALKQIEQGTSASNAAKFLGKFGISEGQATSMLGFSIGAGGGGALGSFFGPGGAALGAVTIPALAQISKKTAQRLTGKSAKFADDLVRSGKDAKKIVRTYLKHTPVKDRNVSDLTDLLLDEGVDVSDIKSLPSSKTPVGRLVSDAKFYASELNRRVKQAGSAALITTPSVEQEQK